MKRYKYTLLAVCFFSALIFHANAIENTEETEIGSVDSTNTNSIDKSFDYILIERNGGGDKLFSLSKGEGDYYITYFSRYNFKDTTFRLDLKIHEFGDTLSNAIDDILSGEISLTETDTVANARGFAMGSWMRSYAVKDTLKTKITNRNLLSEITAIENKIEQKINSSKAEK